MSEENPTIEATGVAGGAGATERAYLIVDAGGDRTRVVELDDGGEVTFGRSRAATIVVDHEKVSRMHARVTRRGAHIAVEDLGSRNGTWVNGARVEAPARIAGGDEITVGPAVAVLAVSSQLRQRARVASVEELDDRLEAEVDRAARYHRPLGLLMIRLDGEAGAVDGAVERVAASLRRMDLCADYAADELAILLPDSDRAETEAAAVRIVREARAGGASVDVRAGLSVYPADGAHAGQLISRARAALRRARQGAAGGIAAPPDESAPDDADLVVADPQMRRIHELAGKAARASIGVLLLGETGVGKEIVAEQIHRRSARAGRPFVRLSCASLPETLLESELFGHERGAFTGAERRKIGYFEAADGGTIFLDEIGETPPSLQAKLLRVIETHRLSRVGGTTEIPVDARLVCATNRDLEAEVRRGRFRQDLFFRVSAFTIIVPPLRDRRGEIVPLARHFARQLSRELSRATPELSPEAARLLEAHPWPGNVRELRNAVERALVLCPGAVVTPEHLPDSVRLGAPPPATQAGPVRDRVADVERAAIVAALEEHGWNQTHAAQRLGLSRRALIYKMEKYGLKPAPASAR
jgi:two-component system response regulator AtoC